MMFVQNLAIIYVVSVTAKFPFARFLVLKEFSFQSELARNMLSTFEILRFSTFRQLKSNVLRSTKILLKEPKYV